jgi:hypothetical protein
VTDYGLPGFDRRTATATITPRTALALNVVLLDAPLTAGRNIRRAVDEIASANGVSNKVTHLIYSHHSND